MSQGITTSIRLPTKLREDLEQAARSLHRGKNWIIAKALEDYLAKINSSHLAKEARRQSLLASKTDKDEAEIWLQNSDETGWE